MEEDKKYQTTQYSPTMEDWFTGEQFSKDTTDCPNVNRLKEKNESCFRNLNTFV